VLLGGPRLRARGRAAAFLELADAFKGGVATTADGKGLFPEDHPQFIGERCLSHRQYMRCLL
jgi:thiamine pyrophosphate-dependent acetolactate synthase large subunit-like protein